MRQKLIARLSDYDWNKLTKNALVVGLAPLAAVLGQSPGWPPRASVVCALVLGLKACSLIVLGFVQNPYLRGTANNSQEKIS